MKIALLCSALSLVGLFACMDPQESTEQAPVSEAELQAKDELDLDRPTDEGTLDNPDFGPSPGCCINYSCNGVVRTTGCKTPSSGPSLPEAKAECDASCSVRCTAGNLYCDPIE